MYLEKEKFLQEEKKKNIATNFYHKITLLESGAVKRIFEGLILCNLILLLLLFIDKNIYGGNPAITIGDILVLIGFEVLIVLLWRIDDFKFNKILKNGIVLKTVIEQEYNMVYYSSSHYGFRIHSYYYYDDEKRLVFMDAKKHYANKKIFDYNFYFPGLYRTMTKKLEAETYINVIVNPEKCSKYYMVISEIGVPEADKYDAPYSKKEVNIILTILLVLEYIAFCFL